jgi:vitamin B12 transporter
VKHIVAGAMSAVLVLGGLTRPATAEEARRLEPVVVTATKIEEPQERLGATVTVITEEELKLYNYQTVGDALRRVPGLHVQRSGGLGKQTEIRIRGTDSKQVQILIDGMRVKSATTAEFYFSDLALDQIEKIEIVRGPQSTLHGADAIGGVVNIITKRGQGPFSAYASTEAGNYDTLRERAGFSGSWKIVDYALSGSWFEGQGQFVNDGFEERAVTGRVGLTLPATGHVGLSLRYNRTATDLPVDTTIAGSPFFVRDPDAQRQTETTTLGVQWDQKPAEWFEIHARLGAHWSQSGFQDPRTPSALVPGITDTRDQRSQIDTRRREAELVAALHAGTWNTLTLGAEHRVDRGQNRSVGFAGAGVASRFSQEIDTISWFLQDEVRLLDRLILSAGRRHDDNEVFGGATTHRAGLVVLVRETESRLRGTWGEGFRAPTINDLFFPGSANPDLRPERSESWEAGVDQAFWKKRVRLGATYFENSFDDLIQFVFAGGVVRPVNVAQARTEGMEFASAVEVLDALLFSANYTYVDSQDLGTRLELRRVPHHVYDVGITWDPLRVLSLFVQANVVSSQFERVGFPRNPEYHRIDVGGTYHIVPKRGAWPALDLIARVNNVTDQSYMEVFGFRALGINALVGLQARY